MKYKNNSEDDTKEIFIIITNACNLQCRYCYETNKNAPSVDVESIKIVIKNEILNNSFGFNRFLINFHGGEPFLAFPKMVEIVEWVLHSFPDIDITFTCTTNGTLLTDEIRSWLISVKDVFIPILSLDGGPNVHNLNRCNSLTKIPIEFFRSYWPLQGVKMTVCPNTIDQMFDSFLYIQEQGLYANPSLAGEVGWEIKTHLPIYERELGKLADYYVDHPNVKPAPILNLPLKKFSPEYKYNNGNGCGAGLDTVAFDIKGNKYPCHTFISDLSREYNKDEIDGLFSILNKNCNIIVSPKCKGCPIICCCSPCYGLNFSYRGNMGDFDVVRCEFNKITVKCSARMFARIIPRYKDYPWLASYSDNSLYHLINGIKYINSHV
jgi:sulfatase maturation enzyme AslB (radical SAM superfamily)